MKTRYFKPDAMQVLDTILKTPKEWYLKEFGPLTPIPGCSAENLGFGNISSGSEFFDYSKKTWRFGIEKAKLLYTSKGEYVPTEHTYTEDRAISSSSILIQRKNGKEWIGEPLEIGNLFSNHQMVVQLNEWDGLECLAPVFVIKNRHDEKEYKTFLKEGLQYMKKYTGDQELAFNSYKLLEWLKDHCC